MYTPVYLSYEKGSTTIGSGTIDSFITILDEDFALDYYTEVEMCIRDRCCCLQNAKIWA